MSTDKLLDVFVGVGIEKGTIEATERALEEATNRIRGMFGDLQNQSVTAARNAINSINQAGRAPGGGSGGAGRGGRGSSGGPIARDFEEARRLAQDLQQELTVVSRIIRSTGAEDLTAQLQQMADFLRTTTTQIGRQRADRDILGVQDSKARLIEFRQQLQELETRGAVTLNLREQFDQAAQAAREAVTSERIRSRLADSLIRGTPSGDTRKELLEQRAILEDIEDQIKRATAAFDGTQDSVTRLTTALGVFRVAADEMAEIQKRAQEAGPSFNTLTNNAYQLGQAIEDFSVGFSLNGFAGGVRGAANNVAFLINNMVQADFIQGKISEKWKNSIPVLAGVGSAIAVTVLPRLVEWLATLDDIDFALRDISNSASDAFSDSAFEAGLRRQEEEVGRLAQTATTTEEILSRLSESVQKANSQRVLLVEQLSDFFKRPSDGLREFNRELFLLEGRLNKIGTGTNATGGEEASKFVTQMVAGIRSARQSIAQAASDAVTDGTLNTSAVATAVKRLREIRDRFGEAVDRTGLPKNGLTSQDIETIENNLTPLLSKFEDFNQIAQEVASVIDRQLSKGIEQAVQKTEELRSKQELIRGALRGQIGDQAEFLDGLALAGKRFQEQVDEIIRSGEEAGVAADKLAAARSTIESGNRMEIENQLLERQVGLRERIKSLDERIADIREKMMTRQATSRQVTLEALSSGLQANVLSVNLAEELERKRNTEQLKQEVLERQKLIDSMRLLEEAYNSAGDPERMARIARRPADRFSVEPFGASKTQDFARAWLEPILRQMVINQQENTTTVKTKDTTPRAQ